jgi:predicted ATPase
LTESSQKPNRTPPSPYEDLDIKQISPKLYEAIRSAHAESRWPVYFHGNPGRGKSYAMAALYCLWTGRNPVWFDVSALLRSIMRCRTSDDGAIYETRPGGESVLVYESGIMSRIRNADLACFDDVGLRSASDAMYDAFYEIVNSRKGKPTIFTGNLSPKELKEVYDARIASRILAGTLIEFTGEDQRLKKTKAFKV